MNTVIRRIGRLENRLHLAENPRQRIRLVVLRSDCKPSLRNATCQRTLWPNGTLFEMVQFNKHNDRPGELTTEELDRWVESFPVEVLPGQPPGSRER
jgi:hypothetical protein